MRIAVGVAAVLLAGTLAFTIASQLGDTFEYVRPDNLEKTRCYGQGTLASPGKFTNRTIIDYINNNVRPDEIRENLRSLTSKPHMAGTKGDRDSAKWVADKWKEQGFENVHTLSYNVLLSYPNSDKSNFVRLISSTDGAVLFESTPRQKPLYAPEEARDDVSDNFNAYSAPGNVTAGVVYANYGRTSDFLKLQELGVDVEGAIVMARYGKIFRGNIVRTAEKLGALGVILYSDPEDYASPDLGVYPDTVMMPPSAAAFGTVKDFGGDSMTPFYPSIDTAYRLPEEEWDLPHIPAQPLSYGDAYYILQSLRGLEAPASWQGGLNFTYHLGPTLGEDQAVQMEVHTTNTPARVQNVLATIEGEEEPDRYVLIGNHRDAWVFGAIDPSSGTAAMMETSRVLMALHNETGWRPRRTLVFCSWAAEEFGLIGSTEWTEQFSKQLADRAVVYLNSDQAFSGNYSFRAKSTPLLYDLMWEATKQVPNPDPEEVAAGRLTVFDTWLERRADLDHPDRPWINPVAAGSDFVSFLQVLGVTSSDIRYTDSMPEPLYHTLYETFALVDELYDRGFLHHSSVAAVWSILAATLADAKLLPFSPGYYPDFLKTGIQELLTDYGGLIAAQNLSLDILSTASDQFSEDVENFVAKMETVDLSSYAEVRRANDYMMLLERAFLDPRGLPHRPHYLNVVNSPSMFNTYGGSLFPGLSDTLYSISVDTNTTAVASLWRDFEEHLAAVTHFVRSAGTVLSDRLW